MHCTNVTGKVYKSLQESQCLSVPGIVVRDLYRMCMHVFGLQEFRSRGRSCASSCTHQRQTTPCRSKRFGGAAKD